MRGDGPFKGLFRFRSYTDQATYYSNTPELASNSIVVDANGLAVANYSALDLAPYITADAALAKDDATGLDYFRDPTTNVNPAEQRRYLRKIVGGVTTWWSETDATYNRYKFSALDKTVTPNAVIVVYSTTADPAAGILYRTNQTVHDAAVAEWVVAVLLAMRRRLPDLLELQRRSEWDRNLND
ncbi:MAG: hypothetical protein WCO86_16205, partial [Planctomycetota bacterium]